MCVFVCNFLDDYISEQNVSEPFWYVSYRSEPLECLHSYSGTSSLSALIGMGKRPSRSVVRIYVAQYGLGIDEGIRGVERYPPLSPEKCIEHQIRLPISKIE